MSSLVVLDRSGIVSVVLSLSSRTVVVNDYHVLCCPDFPLVKQAAAFQAPSYTNIKFEKIQNKQELSHNGSYHRTFINENDISKDNQLTFMKI